MEIYSSKQAEHETDGGANVRTGKPAWPRKVIKDGKRTAGLARMPCIGLPSAAQVSPVRTSPARHSYKTPSQRNQALDQGWPAIWTPRDYTRNPNSRHKSVLICIRQRGIREVRERRNCSAGNCILPKCPHLPKRVLLHALIVKSCRAETLRT